MGTVEGIDTPRIAATSTYHGVTVTDEYRWLEDATSDETRAWTAAQNARTRAFMEGLPSYAAVRQRVEEVVKAESVTWGDWSGGPRRGGEKHFVLKHEPPRQQPFLVVLGDLDGLLDATVLVDPNAIDETGTTAIDWFSPSPDGRLVAVSLSSHGSEEGTLTIFDVDSQEPVDVTIPRVNTGTMEGSLAWASDSSSFWYARGHGPGERSEEELPFFHELWHHTIGEPLERDHRDQPEAVTDPKIAEHCVESSADGRFVMDRVQRGDSGEWQVFLRPQAGGDWWLVSDISDRCVEAVFGGDALYLLSRRDAPRGQVLRLALANGATAAQAEVIVPESDTAIEGLAATDSRLFLLDIDGGPSGLRVCDSDGDNITSVDVPRVSSVNGLVSLGRNGVVYGVESFSHPRVWWLAEDDAPPRATALADESPIDLSGYEVRREFASSPDGTQVPMTLISLPGTPRDGSAAVLLTGYGGFGIAIKPWFDPAGLPWLEQGGVLVVANLRGGVEYGEQWHESGRLTSKQNVFDDFVACARHLVDSGVTAAERLAVLGASNGGLLMAAVLTQHPEIARVVVAQVPVTDMLRMELAPNGAFNAAEFGTVNDREQFEALRAYSPYHNVRDGAAYPATLLTGGEYDPRVDAFHPKKMAARLQAATSGEEPILLRVKSSGHGIGESLDETVAELTDVYAFIFDRLGLDYRSPA